MGTITLSDAEIALMRDRIRNDCFQADGAKGKECYAELVRAISHPAAVIRVRLVTGAGRLWSKLKVILWARVVLLPLLISFGLLGFIVSRWYFLGCFGVVAALYVLSAVQTHLNMEIAARLFTLDLMLETNPGLLDASGHSDT